MVYVIHAKTSLRFFLINVVESGSNGRAILRIFRYDVFHLVKLLHDGEDVAALWKQREVANHHKLLDVAVERSEHCGTADGLQHSVDQSHGDVLPRSVILGFAEGEARIPDTILLQVA